MADLIPSIAAHALGGVILACGIWTVGLGWLPRPNGRNAPRAYPIGLLAVTVAEALVLLSPWLAIFAAPIVIVPLARLARFGLPLRALVALAWALPGSIGLGFALGYLYHAPTARLDSSASGDFVFYAVRLLSATRSVAPFRDYAVEGMHNTYFESAPTFIGAPLSWLPGFDAFLFGAATLPALFVASLAIGLGLTMRERRAPWPLALLAVSCIAYPTWLTESAPVALAVPLGFAMYSLYRDGASRREWIVFLPLLALDLALTKGFGLVTLFVVAVFALRRHFGVGLRRGLPYIVAAGVVAALALGAFFATSGWFVQILGAKFLPADALRGLHSEFRVRNSEQLTPALRVLGESLLIVALVRARATTFAAAAAAGMIATWFVGGHGLDVTIGLAVLLAVLFFAEDRAAFGSALPWILAASVVLCGSAWLRDISGVRSGAVLVTLVALALVAVLGEHPSARFAALAAAVVALATPVLVHRGPTTLRPADYAIWQRVEDIVPTNGLVFTSSTGPEQKPDQGYDYYPAIARRPLYIAGWANSRLLVDDAKRRRRLDLNRRVLEGELAPERAQLFRRYSQFFAVTRRDEPPPSSFHRLYANGRYALYRIES